MISNRHRRRALIAALALSLSLPTGLALGPVGGAQAAQPSARLADPAADLAAEAERLLEAGLMGDAESMTSYVVVRNQLADLVSERVLADPAMMRDAWRDASIDHQRALIAALTQLGVPYRSMTSSEGEGFDCSGLTYFAWSESGRSLARNSSAQISAADPRSYDTAQAGDLVQYPGHVMMYLGVDDAVVHSPYTGRWVEVRRVGGRSVRVGDPTV